MTFAVWSCDVDRSDDAMNMCGYLKRCGAKSDSTLDQTVGDATQFRVVQIQRLCEGQILMTLLRTSHAACFLMSQRLWTELGWYVLAMCEPVRECEAAEPMQHHSDGRKAPVSFSNFDRPRLSRNSTHHPHCMDSKQTRVRRGLLYPGRVQIVWGLSFCWPVHKLV